MPGPAMQRRSRRRFLSTLGLLITGAGAGAAWYLNQDHRDWLKRVQTFRYGTSAELQAAMFVPTIAAERACPLLLLLDHSHHGDKLCARFAKHCEEHGWIAATTNAFGFAPAPGDSGSARMFLDAVKGQANVDGDRAVVAGYDASGEAAMRLAIVEPALFAGAILECSGISAWREVGAFTPNGLAFFLFTRRDDPHRELNNTMKDEMERRGINVTYSEFDGRQEPMERDEMDPAFTWMDGLQRS